MARSKIPLQQKATQILAFGNVQADWVVACLCRLGEQTERNFHVRISF
ncbi:MAG: hypothetical protein RMK89_07085 [Armatimonadota bacterium]|nr:hypothetical protein [Armatimonadota bacterium]MDW8143209.1 hypothetical protein [Armatimonadota bacterium]